MEPGFPLDYEAPLDVAGQRIYQRMLAATGRRWDIFKRLIARSTVSYRGYKTPCFEWWGPTSGTGTGAGRGYGRMTLNDTTCATHKVAWTNENGYVPPGKQLDHKCENRRCWREDHLELVSHKRNQALRAKRRKDRASQTEVDRADVGHGREDHGAEVAQDGVSSSGVGELPAGPVQLPEGFHVSKSGRVERS